MALGTGVCAAQPNDAAPRQPDSGIQIPAPHTSGLPATLPLKRDPVLGSESGDPLRGRGWAVFGLLVVIFAGVLVYRARASDKGLEAPKWMRRMGVSFSDAPVRVVHSVRLTPHASLHLVRWNDQEWLLGCSESGMLLVGQSRVPWSPAAASDEGRADQCNCGVQK
jgi:hypothetical protein